MANSAAVHRPYFCGFLGDIHSIRVQSCFPVRSNLLSFICKLSYYTLTSPKSIPWFVSDVTPPDFPALLSSLSSPDFFPKPSSSDLSELATDYLGALTSRWQSYFESGAFSLSVPLSTQLGEKNDLIDFWTGPDPHWCMKERAPKLAEILEGSGLVIFKVCTDYHSNHRDIFKCIPFRVISSEFGIILNARNFLIYLCHVLVTGS